MSEQPPTPPTVQDFPDHWGFYLLQAINRLDEAERRDQEQTANVLRQEIYGTHSVKPVFRYRTRWQNKRDCS